MRALACSPRFLQAFAQLLELFDQHGLAHRRLLRGEGTHHRGKRVHGKPRDLQAARIELGREIDRLREPLFEGVRDVGQRFRNRWSSKSS